MYIKRVEITKLLNVENHNIEVSNDYPHLILTGPNGSGKTRILSSLKNVLDKFVSKNPPNLDQLRKIVEHNKNQLKKGIGNPAEKNQYRHNVDIYSQKLEDLTIPANISWFDYNYLLENVVSDNFTYIYLDARRKTQFKQNKTITNFNYEKNFIQSSQKVNNEFLTYLLSLKQQKSFAKSEDNSESPDIDKFFNQLEITFRELFDMADLKLHFEYKNLDFFFVSKGKRFNFHELSDGYSAVIDLFTEILSRQIPSMKKTFEFNQPGLVIIDEIETHLHLELQKSILPILMKLFPRVQFVLSTHSPFVINSCSNITVYDLKRKEHLSNLYAYSFERIVENFYNLGLHNEELNQELDKLNRLLDSEERTTSDDELIRALFYKYQNINFDNNEQLMIKFRQAMLKRRIIENVQDE